MTTNDRILIEKAQHTIWENMDELIEQCESDEARWKITAMMKDRYHREND